jgi:glycosyltransferase involved in cell wall biosynthesis
VNDDRPLVTVGLVTYARPQYLDRALASLSGQDYANLDIVVSNNCSPLEDTERVCRRWVAREPRIRYFLQKRNLGLWGNAAFVLQQAEGEYFMWAADDDSWEPNFVSTLVQCFIAEPELTFAHCRQDVHRWIDAERFEVRVVEEGRFFAFNARNTAFENCLEFLRKFAHLLGSQGLGMYRTDAIRRAARVMTFSGESGRVALPDFAPILGVITQGRAHFVPETLFHLGFVPKKTPHSAAIKRKGLYLGARYNWPRTLSDFSRAVVRSPRMTIREKLRVTSELWARIMVLAYVAEVRR